MSTSLFARSLVLMSLLCTLTGVTLAAQPDVLIRTTLESAYTGDGIYNATGAGQTKNAARAGR